MKRKRENQNTYYINLHIQSKGVDLPSVAIIVWLFYIRFPIPSIICTYIAFP